MTQPRRAGAADAQAIAEVHIAAWRAAYRGLMPDAYLGSLSVAQRTDFWTRTLSRAGPGQIVVAELDGAMGGFAFFGPTRDDEPQVAEIYSVNIRPEAWRRGLGRALCEYALREAQARECSAVTLWVLRENQAARRFYEALGYAADGVERVNTGLIGSPLHEMRYRKLIG
jgi:ribosomal protein S18 acetylase RimI-like enzyme